MRIITGRKLRRKVYAWKEGGEFMLSPFEATSGNRRPIARFDSKQDLEAAARSRNCEVVWQSTTS